MSARTVRPLVGRLRERAAVAEIWAAAQAGRPSVTLVSGEAGAGKTALLRHTEQLARDAGGLTMIGHCVQVAGLDLPYLPIAGALRSVAEDPVALGVLRDEAASWPALARLVPQLGTQMSSPGADLPADHPSLSARHPGESFSGGEVFQALQDFLLRLAEVSPVLLVLEDLHWADRTSRDVLTYLARTLQRGRIAIFLSYRTDDLHRLHPLRPVLAELNRLPQVERIELGPLSLTELTELLETVAGKPLSPTVTTEIHRRSAGNAFFAQELLLAADRPDGRRVPEALADVLLSRLIGLSEQGRGVVELTAVAGGRVAEPVLLTAGGISPEDIDIGIRDAVDSGLLVTDGPTYAFHHALVQEAIYDNLLPGHRIRLHRRFASALADVVQPGDWATLAHHLRAAGDLSGALAATVTAAAHAESVDAPAEALRQLETALELLQHNGSGADRLDLLTRAVSAAAASAQPDRANTLARTAVAEADTRPNISARITTRLTLADCALRWGGGTEAESISASRQAAALLNDSTPAALRAATLLRVANAVLWGEPEHADELLAEAIRVADQAGAASISTHAAINRTLLQWRQVIPGDAPSGVVAALAAAERNGAGPDVQLWGAIVRIWYLTDAGDMTTAIDVADAALARAGRAGLELSGDAMELTWERARALTAIGRWDEVLDDGLAAGHSPTRTARELSCHAHRVLVRRRSPEADQLLERMRGDSTGLDAMLALGRRDQWLDQHRPTEVVAQAEAATADLMAMAWRVEAFETMVQFAAAHADLADDARQAGDLAAAAGHADAATRAETMANAAQVWLTFSPYPYGVMLWAQLRAEIARAAGTATPETWAEVAAHAERAGRVYDRVRALLREGQARLAAGDRGTQTVQALQTALSGARLLKAAGLIDDIHALASRARIAADVGSAQGVPDDGGNPLTSRETQVLRLVGAGRTNTQIGHELFISDKTVSVHLSHVFDKIGATNRTEAVAMARHRGWLT